MALSIAEAKARIAKARSSCPGNGIEMHQAVETMFNAILESKPDALYNMFLGFIYEEGFGFNEEAIDSLVADLDK